MALRSVSVTRYVTPFRQAGSLPALGLLVPEQAFVEMDEAISRSEPETALVRLME